MQLATSDNLHDELVTKKKRKNIMKKDTECKIINAQHCQKLSGITNLIISECKKQDLNLIIVDRIHATQHHLCSHALALFSTVSGPNKPEPYDQSHFQVRKKFVTS